MFQEREHGSSEIPEGGQLARQQGEASWSVGSGDEDLPKQTIQRRTRWKGEKEGGDRVSSQSQKPGTRCCVPGDATSYLSLGAKF